MILVNKFFLRKNLSSNQILNCLFLSKSNKFIQNNNHNLLKLDEKVNIFFVRYQSNLANKNENDKPNKRKSNLKLFYEFKFSWKTLGISLVLCSIYFGFIYYLKKEKEYFWEREQQRIIGKAAIGGPFELIDTERKTVTNKDFLGKWCLIYFGFTHCPDVCPEELEKLVEVYHDVSNKQKEFDIVPIFISVDPERDTPELVKKYCLEFSDKLIGLTGSADQIKACSKAYRVYYSAGPKSKEKDYIVDHTIIIYLINPEGEFVDYYGQSKNKEEITNLILMNMKKYKNLKNTSWFKF